ncbi:RNA recognition motif domain [Arabidopsis suecica]|uniref:RNA recognition motif domain n=1 Tax=Arabidopsis suecica TaxID=45249 RepID=A0A8T2HH83_ARASU|nr:RNA recognition motif domain [Arabidopsis suecica]
MAESSKLSATTVEAAPAMIKAKDVISPSEKEESDQTEITKVSVLKNLDEKEMIKEFADRLQRLEAKVDLLVTKADLLEIKADIQELLISAKGEKVPAMKTSAKASSESDDSYMDTSSEDESSSAEEPVNKPAASAAKPATKDSLFSAGFKPAAKDSLFSAGFKPDSLFSAGFEPAAKDSLFSAGFKPGSLFSAGFEPAAKDSLFSAGFKPDSLFSVGVKPAAKDSLFSVGVNGRSFSVTGFDASLPVDDIKSALSKYFSSFGEITRVFVPPSHGTGGSLGYAYIDLKEGAEKALELGRHDVGGWDLVVGKAEPIRSGSTWPFPGRCGNQGRCTFC